MQGKHFELDSAAFGERSCSSTQTERLNVEKAEDRVFNSSRLFQNPVHLFDLRLQLKVDMEALQYVPESRPCAAMCGPVDDACTSLWSITHLA